MNTPKGSFKCPECGDEELTSAYFYSAAYGKGLQGKFSNAICFNCYAGLVGSEEDRDGFMHKVEHLFP